MGVRKISPVYIGDILRGVHEILPILYRKDIAWGYAIPPIYMGVLVSVGVHY